MDTFSKNQSANRRLPNEVLGLDLGCAAVKAVRLRNGKEGLSVVAAEILPPINRKPGDALPSLELPPKLVTNYAAVTFSSSQQVVRIINVSGVGDQDAILATKLQDILKVENNQRLAFEVLRTVPGKRETQMLTVTAPEKDVQDVLELLASGPPAALSLQHAGLAALTAYHHGVGREMGEETVCFIESGARTTFIAFIIKGDPVLVRTLDLGGENLVERLQTQWGLDRETALGTMGQGATIDISQPVHELAGPFLRQLNLSRDFVERQENCRISRVFVSGGMSMLPQWSQEIHEAMGLPVQSLDPFQHLTLGPHALPAALDSQRLRLTAAVGAALAVFEDS